MSKFIGSFKNFMLCSVQMDIHKLILLFVKFTVINIILIGFFVM